MCCPLTTRREREQRPWCCHPRRRRTAAAQPHPEQRGRVCVCVPTRPSNPARHRVISDKLAAGSSVEDIARALNYTLKPQASTSYSASITRIMDCQATAKPDLKHSW
jgi:hypothetical protein